MVKSLVFGVGINDAGYVVQPVVSGKQVMCPFYQRWTSMLKRCYCESELRRFPTYEGCTVCEEWLSFSNFKVWMEKQDWKGKYLDKDLIKTGNKIYSPETCVFVDGIINGFLLDSKASRGPYKIGVTWSEWRGMFNARCANPFEKSCEHLGYFTDEESAHQEWKKKKRMHACALADLQGDARVATALRLRYV